MLWSEGEWRIGDSWGEIIDMVVLFGVVVCVCIGVEGCWGGVGFIDIENEVGGGVEV